jgi:hypothetical protein
MQTEKSFNFLIIASILSRTLNIVAVSPCNPRFRSFGREKKHHPDGQSCEKLIIMQAVRQVKIALISSLNFKNRVNTLTLDNQRTSVCCKSVTWSLPISLHSAENTQVQEPCFNHFHCSFQNVFQAVRHYLGSKSLLVDAAVYPSGIRSNCLHARYHSTMSPCHGFCSISTDTNTS